MKTPEKVIAARHLFIRSLSLSLSLFLFIFFSNLARCCASSTAGADSSDADAAVRGAGQAQLGGDVAAAGVEPAVRVERRTGVRHGDHSVDFALTAQRHAQHRLRIGVRLLQTGRRDHLAVHKNDKKKEHER